MLALPLMGSPKSLGEYNPHQFGIYSNTDTATLIC